MSSSHPSGRSGPPMAVFGPDIEDSVVGTWFARLGVIALLIGAAFGYRYAVDQGMIGPVARVTLGFLCGSAFVGWGYVARRNGWTNFAHAITGGGVAILYLSVLAAQFRFDLISPGAALALLTGVALLSAWLAIGYDSLALAILASVGAFMNPFFLAADDPTAALSYLVGIDVAVVAMAFGKRWHSLNKLALAGTVGVVGLVAARADVVEGIGFTTVLWVLFTTIPFIQAARDRRDVGVVDAGLVVTVGFLYLGAGMFFADPLGPVSQGVFALVAGLAYAVFAAVAYSYERTRLPLASILGALAIGFTTLAAGLITEGATTYLLWAIQGAVVLYISGVMDDVLARIAAVGLIMVGLLGTVDAMSTYVPDRLLLSPTSISIAIEIAVLYATAWIVSRLPIDEEVRGVATQATLVLANLMTIGWLSQEARHEVLRTAEPSRVYAATQFALSAVWGIYSAALIGIGVATKQRWARYLGLATFAMTLLKMVTVDLWQLEILQRTVAFVGLGVLMIGCSFLYNRFRTYIVGDV